VDLALEGHQGTKNKGATGMMSEVWRDQQDWMIILYYAVLCCTALRCAVLCQAGLHFPALCCGGSAVMCFAVLYYLILGYVRCNS